MEKSGNIIILSHGTDNKFGRNNTNGIKLYQALESSENRKCFYDPGVGTCTPAGIIQNLLGSAFFPTVIMQGKVWSHVFAV